MEISDLFIHDARILKVIEDTEMDTIDFLLDYPVNWEKNLFEKRVLRFFDPLYYTVSEIPFDGIPAVIQFSDYSVVSYKLGEGINTFTAERKKVNIITNAGHRSISFSRFELL